MVEVGFPKFGPYCQFTPCTGLSVNGLNATQRVLVPVCRHVVWRRVNSNALAMRFQPGIANGAFVAVALPVCVLQLARVTPFLYFNF